MNLSLVSEDQSGVYVACRGDIALDHLQPTIDLLANVMGPAGYAKRVHLDLENTSYIDSAGIGWLIMCHKRFVEHGGKLVLYSVPPVVEQVLRLLKLETILTLAGDRDEARAK